MAAALCPLGRVYAVEPISEYIAALEDNKALNSLSNVEIVQAALGDHEGVIGLFVAGNRSGTHFVSATSTETVRLTSLQQLMQELRIERIDLLKMDCEGAEWEILPAALEVLPRIMQICMEFHPDRGWTGDKLAAFLRESGYEVWYTQEAPWNGALWARRSEPGIKLPFPEI